MINRFHRPAAGTRGAWTLALILTISSISISALAQSGDPEVLYRVNAGGPELAALAGDPDPTPWSEDTLANPSPWLIQDNSPNSSTPSAANAGEGNVPPTVPDDLFFTERWDGSSPSDMTYGFPVDAGLDVYVRVYLRNGCSCTDQAGERIFDVLVNGETVAANLDLSGDIGHLVPHMVEAPVTSDGMVTVSFGKVTENPLVNGIEIVVAGPQPGILSVSPPSIAFGSVSTDSSATETITLKNQGESGDPDIEITNFSIGGDFSTTLSTGLVLAPGAEATADVTFSPQSAGQQTDTLSISHDGDNSPVEISMSGEGFDPDAAPISFSSQTITNLNNPSQVEFGPDGRLYVSELKGLIYAFEIERDEGTGDYAVLDTEVIGLIQTIPNHNDDGSSHSSTQRNVTGMATAGTAENPVLYVSSSDPRIDNAAADTNSGVVSRLTWTGSEWIKLDLVRGLPRSAHDHLPNGLALDAASGMLYLAQGGHTNQGAPSNNFKFLPEYALSAAILAIDLDAIGESTYDIPTLKETPEPWGGQFGDNQAVMVADGPVQVYAPGFRNAYDVLLTQDGRLYTADNGPNSGWGAVPAGEGTPSCTNETQEPGSTHSDGLHLITHMGYYGGHPNPTRANRDNTFDGLSPIPVGLENPDECDYLAPGSEDGALTLFSPSSNGLAEYTATNFGGAMLGDIITTQWNGNVARVQLNSDGTQAVSNDTLFSGLSGPLGVTAQGDSDPFPGTIWIGQYGSGNITVFEPIDFSECDPATLNPDDLSPNGYTYGDLMDNGLDPCNPAQVPPDFDQDFVSDLNDDDIDGDGILNDSDIFDFDADNGRGTSLPHRLAWTNDVVGGLGGMSAHNAPGFTGLMAHPDGSVGVLDLFDPDNLIPGGAAGIFTVEEVSVGDAHQSTNTQENAFHFGVDVDSTTGVFTVRTRVLSPFAGSTPQNWQSMGLAIGNGDQDNYIKLVVASNNGNGGIQFAREEGGTFNGEMTDAPVLGADYVDLYLVIDPAAGTVSGDYVVSIDGERGPRTPVVEHQGGPVTIPSAWLNDPVNGLAVGSISTANGAVPFPASWGFFEVYEGDGEFFPEPAFDGVLSAAPTALDFESVPVGSDSTVFVDLVNEGSSGDSDITVTNVTVDGDAGFTTNFPGSLVIPAGESESLSVTFAPDTVGEFLADLVIGHDGIDSPLMVSLIGTGTDGQTVIHRINAGGPEVTAGGELWAADALFSGGSIFTVDSTTEIANTDADEIYTTERYGDPFTYTFPVEDGNYKVRLHFAELWHGVDGNGGGTYEAGDRIFDVSVNESPWLVDYDLFEATGAPLTAVIEELDVEVTGGELQLSFSLGDSGADNAKLSAIEVIAVDSDPPGPDPVPGATLEITPGGGLTASTYSGDAFVITNTGDLPIATVSIDLSTAILPDMVFDPVGDGGDVLGKCLEPSSGAAETGYIAPADPCSDPFSGPHDGGYDVITMQFADFGPGESFIFAVDIDPTSIKDATGTGDAGAVSGLELSGSTVVMDFDDGSSEGLSLASEVFQITPSSQGGSLATLRPEVPVAPSIGVQGIALDPITLNLPAGETGPASHQAAFVDVTVPDVTVQVDTGMASQEVRLLVIEGAMFATNGFELEPFEANEAIQVRSFSATTDSEGMADINVALTRDDSFAASGYNYMTVVVDDPEGAGLTSQHVILRLVDDPDNPNQPPVANDDSASVAQGETVEIDLLANDTDTDGILDASSIQIVAPPAFGTLTPLPLGVVEYAHDGSSELTDSFTYTVSDNDGGVSNEATVSVDVVLPPPPEPGVLFRVNAGGPELVDDPGWLADTSAAPSEFVNNGQSGNQTFLLGDNGSVEGPIDTSHPSIPDGTPVQVFESERWDPTNPEPPMTWTFPVNPDRQYRVRLYFAEIWTGGAGGMDVGTRVFDVAINGEPVLQDYDIFEQVGSAAGVVETFNVVDGADQIVIEFLRNIENPAIKGIEIIDADLIAEPASLKFGAVDIDDVVEETIQLFNPTDSTITISEQALEGDPVFISLLDLDAPLELGPGATAEFNIAFSPDMAGRFAGKLVLEHDGALSHLEIPLAGWAPEAQTSLYRVNAGGASIIDPPWSGDTDATPSPFVDSVGTDTSATSTAIDMNDPSIPPGTPEQVFQSERWLQEASDAMVWTFPVEPGDVEVRLYFAETYTGITGPGERVFDVAINGDVVLEDFDQFAEAGFAAGIVKSFDVTVDAAGGDETVVIELLRGAFDNPAIKGIEIIPQPELAISPAVHDFGSVRVGESAPHSFLVSNVGHALTQLTLAGLDLLGADAFDFDPVASDCEVGTELAGGESCEVVVEFTPATRDDLVASLEVASDANDATSDLTGTGIAPVLAADPAAIDFGPVAFQETEVQSVTLTNTGDADLLFGEPGLSGDDAGQFSIEFDGCGNQTLASTVSCEVQVSLTPDITGVFTAQLDLPSDALEGPDFVPLTGEGIPADAAVTLGDLEQTYDGDPKLVTVATDPEGLTVVVTYDGSETPPTDAGSYPVVATVDDPNWVGEAAGTLVINPAGATVTLGDLEQTYDGDPKLVTVTTDPEGLTVVVTYDGSETPPTDAGSYPVVATVDDPNWVGEATGMLVINPAGAAVTLGDLEQTYDGDPKPVTVTTDPEGLTVVVTYDGSETPPTDAGSYPVVATVDDPNWVGEAAGTLVINPTSQSIDFEPIADRTADDPLVLTLTATADSGLPVSFAVLSGPASVDGNTLTLTGEAGTISVEATQTGDDNWLPADPVEQSFQVTAGVADSVAINDGDGQTGIAGEALPVSPSIRVSDSLGNPVSGVTVGFEVISGGGSASATTQVSDADGIARVGSWVLGSEPGEQQLQATAPGLDGSPVHFTAFAGNVVDLEISGSVEEGDPVEPGDEVTYELMVENLAELNGASGVLIDITLPTGTSLTESSGCAEGSSGGVPVCTLGELAAGASATVMLTVLVTEDTPETMELSAEVSSDQIDSDPENNQIFLLRSGPEAEPANQADLAIFIEPVWDFVPEGGEIQFVVLVTNLGPVDTLGATVSSEFGAGLENLQWNCSPGPGASCLASGSGEIMQLVNLGDGASATFNVVATLADAGSDEEITSSVLVIEPTEFTDPDLSNNIDEVTVRSGIFADGFESEPPGPF